MLYILGQNRTIAATSKMEWLLLNKMLLGFVSFEHFGTFVKML